MKKQMQILFPIMLTLMSASGGVFSASVCRPAVGFFCNTIVSIIHSVVMPITITIMILSLASNLTKELKIGKFTAFFKSINKWIIGVCISVFGLFFTLQGITAATYDGVARRAAKYAIGNGIPIVGGFLSGGFDLAIAGSILIKNSLGSMSIFLMISVLFEPIALLLSVTVLLRFTAAVAQPFGDSRISDFLGETADNLQYCTAGLLLTAFLYFLSIMLFVSASEVLF
jgi:stage III sporulation protein AE